ncbi:hypothetical protein [Nocardioides gilvus]|uniref:hypothetical protein n=1 Tax=Nocardioides gilvus TaxID=1735589 RepID=UPI000D74257A|nr:hypothetical protein [Nocardioides gilvus]
MDALTRRRTTFALLVTGGLVASSLAAAGVVTGAGAAAPAPAGDCAVPFPVSELADGDAVTGLTVERGVTPSAFTGEVLGVLDNGIAPGIDMVMVDLTSPGIDRVGAIWQGMSGSPVYAADGRLIGAVSYGLAAGPSQIAGVTPFEAMDDYAAAPSATGTIKIDRTVARSVARRAEVSVTQAQKGFRQLPAGLSVSGIDTDRASGVLKRNYRTSPLGGVNSAPRTTVGAEGIIAGGNLGASASYGDVTAAGVGTVTSVCKGRVFGFGHPLGYLGETSLAMHGASVVHVQPSPADIAFKVANLGAPVGTVDQDSMAGLTGSLGVLPRGTVVSSTATYGKRVYAGSSVATVPEMLADVAYMQIAASMDRAVDATMRGNAEIAWMLEGSQNGTPVRLKLTDRYVAEYDVAYEAGAELAELTYAVNQLPGMQVDRITADATVAKDTSSYRLRAVKRRVKGKWVRVKGRVPVKAGATLQLRVVLEGQRSIARRTLSIVVPKRLRGEQTEIQVTGGAGHYVETDDVSSLADLKAYLAATVRNDQVAAELTFAKGKRVVTRRAKSLPTKLQIVGDKTVRIRVR